MDDETAKACVEYVYKYYELVDIEETDEEIAARKHAEEERRIISE